MFRIVDLSLQSRSRELNTPGIIFRSHFFAYANIWGGNYLSYGYMAASFVGASVIYFLSKRSHIQKGLDISLVFKEIPPE
jgi:hypothetical protein